MKVYPLSQDRMETLSYLNAWVEIAAWALGIGITLVATFWPVLALESGVSDTGRGVLKAGIVGGFIVIGLALVGGACAFLKRRSILEDIKRRARDVTI